METFHAVNRRRFLAAAAGGLLATLPARQVWPVQTASLRRGLGAVGPRWRPTADLLHTLPRLLELAAVPGLALATVDDGGIVSKASGRASLRPPRGVGDGTVFEAASLGKPLFDAHPKSMNVQDLRCHVASRSMSFDVARRECDLLMKLSTAVPPQ